MGVFDRNGDGATDGVELGRTVAEGGLWLDAARRSGGPGPSGPGCSCSGCLTAVLAVALLLGALLFSLGSR